MVDSSLPAHAHDIRRLLARLARTGLDLVLPPQCLGCGALVGGEGALCADCWQGIAFLGPPHCEGCGYPFEFGAEGGVLCAACIAGRPPWQRARAVFRYDDSSRGLVLGFKHADRCHGVPAFAAWMARAGAELLADADVIAPVPLHRWRLLARRYNQSALLALALARRTGRPCIPDLLWRTRVTPSQGRMSRRQRRRNVRGAFAVHPRHRASVTARRILLIDDVFTTGATADAAARVLLAAGATAVDVLTLARVVRPA